MLSLAFIPSQVMVSEAHVVDEMVLPSNPYNLILPLVGSLLLYWVSYYICKKRKKIVKFNAFWNTILFITLLIPSLGFGIFMMLRYRFVHLYDISFDFMYWHVELSIVMSVIALSHFAQRFKTYLVQMKK